MNSPGPFLPRHQPHCPAYPSDAIADEQSRLVYLTLPKFNLSSNFDLGQTLTEMGMRDAFIKGTANFNGLIHPETGDYAWISKVIHQAVITVDEAGTEAAAATAVVVGVMCSSVQPSPPPPVEFRADHPFLFAIRDMQTGAIQFMGQVTNPTAR